MTTIYEKIIEEIHTSLNNNRDINRIRLDDDAYNELMNSDQIIARRDSNAVKTEVSGFDVVRDPIVDEMEVDKEEQYQVHSPKKCWICSNQRMYDTKNEEFYCPICKV